MTYKLLIERRAIEELEILPGHIQERIKAKIKEILIQNPLPGGKGDIKKLKNSPYWRLRIGDYRVRYRPDRKEKKVYILSIQHRAKAYR